MFRNFRNFENCTSEATSNNENDHLRIQKIWISRCVFFLFHVFANFFCLSSTWEILLVVGSREGLGRGTEVWNSAKAQKALGEILEKLYELSRR